MLGETGGRGRDSGIMVAQPYASLNAFEDGRLVRHQGYLDHAEALEAAGLPVALGDHRLRLRT
jgi:ketosteroid isomerase-like protein